MIDWLQDWFEKKCDGDWEHEHSIRIETIDNPGWNIEINLASSLNSQKWQLFELSEDNWVGYKIENNIFIASGDPRKLNLLILIFKEFIENGILDNKSIIAKMNHPGSIY